MPALYSRHSLFTIFTIKLLRPLNVKQKNISENISILKTIFPKYCFYSA